MPNPTFTPTTATFNDHTSITLDFSSSDNVLENTGFDAGELTIFINDQAITSNGGNVEVYPDIFLHAETSLGAEGAVDLYAFNSAGQEISITMTFHITKLMYKGKEYDPA